MGVRTCHRGDCANIMCDRYNSEFGYLCDDCFAELVALGPGTDIQIFMRTPTPRYRDRDAERDYFETIFPIDY